MKILKHIKKKIENIEIFKNIKIHQLALIIKIIKKH